MHGISAKVRQIYGSPPDADEELINNESGIMGLRSDMNGISANELASCRTAYTRVVPDADEDLINNESGTNGDPSATFVTLLPAGATTFTRFSPSLAQGYHIRRPRSITMWARILAA